MKTKETILIWLLVVWATLMYQVQAKQIMHSAVKDAVNGDKAKVIDLLISNFAVKNIKIYDDPDYLQRKHAIMKSKLESKYDECYAAIERHTRNLFKDEHKAMLSYSFTDVGDMGNYQEWKNIPEASYYVLQLNVTQLPLDVRLGVCLPVQCDQEAMTRAGEVISDTLTGLVTTLGSTLHIEIIEEFKIGLQVTFFGPDQWSESQQDEKAGAASAFGAVLVFAFSFSLLAGSAEQFKGKKSIKDELPNYGKKLDDFDNVFAQDEQIVRESTKPFTFKFNNKEDGAYQRLDSIGNLVEGEERENSIFNERFKTEKTQGSFYDEPDAPIYLRILSCFSPSKNIYRLVETPRKSGDHPELEVFEGIKVLTMCWCLLTTTSIYVLTLNWRNLYVMLYFFNQYLFALIASGNLAPDLFLFVIYFLGFLHMSKIDKITKRTYLGLYLYRFFKFAPLYYFVFFAGWFMVPLLSQAGGWFISERLFWNCEAQWYYVLLFINQLVPFFTKALEGCYYWTFLISNDLLLYSLFPLWVIIYKRNKNVFYCLNSLLLVGGMLITSLICYFNDLTVGILTFEDYYLYSYQFNKPYTKLVSVAWGMFTALFYLRILEYRKASETQKERNYSIIHFMKNSKIVTILLFVYGAGMLMFINSVALTANQDSYSWTETQNVMFYTFGRLAYISSIMAILGAIFLGKAELIRRFLSQKLWRPFSRLTFAALLIHPIAIALTFYATDQGIYLNYLTVIYYYVINIVMTFVIAFALYMLIQAPIDNMIQLTKSIINKSGGRRSSVKDKVNAKPQSKVDTADGVPQVKHLEKILEQSHDDMSKIKDN